MVLIDGSDYHPPQKGLGRLPYHRHQVATLVTLGSKATPKTKEAPARPLN